MSCNCYYSKSHQAVGTTYIVQVLDKNEYPDASETQLVFHASGIAHRSSLRFALSFRHSREGKHSIPYSANASIPIVVP